MTCIGSLIRQTVAIIFSGTLLASARLDAQSVSPHEHLSLDAHWKFHLGDDWPEAIKLDKCQSVTGPLVAWFNDQAWRTVDLPHDWAIELPFDPAGDMSHGYKALGPGFPQNSIGWYRRKFELTPADAGKRIWLQFDGVFRDATVCVNGWRVLRHESGYSSFRTDITDIVTTNRLNLITVKVDASQFEGWFYEGAGIYRHVWLDKTDPVAIAPDGIFVTSSFPQNQPGPVAGIHAEVTINNAQEKAVAAKVQCEVRAAGETAVLTRCEQSVELGAWDQKPLSLAGSLEQPRLWSPETPQLYRLTTTVSVAGQIVDRLETEFGIRTVAFDKDRGCLLNGQPYVIKGTCNHQDHAGVGVALPDALQLFRIKKLKEMGANAYRCSHHPPTPELLEACDRLGMLVLDENRLLGSSEQNLALLRGFVVRDRNHPSVCIWSICNEENTAQGRPEGAKVGLVMQRLVKSLDPTRPVTAAENVGDYFNGLMGALEVRGWNYHLFNKDKTTNQVDSYHAKHPEQPNLGTEQASTFCTRGVYQADRVRGYVTAYDREGIDTAESWWTVFAERPWLSGGFVWTGFDYRGEPGLWPNHTANFGVLDTCGFPKDNFWYYQAWWTSRPVLHLLPHWNWTGLEGQEIRVDALSNCDEVELFLNGQSQGRKTMKRNSKLTWKVKYAPGTLSAQGYAGGKMIAEQKMETTGAPRTLLLAADRAVIRGDGEDVSVVTVSVLDAAGRPVPVASHLVHFAVSGPGKIIGVGNGDPSCLEPDTTATQPAVKTISLAASSPGAQWLWCSTNVPRKGDVLPEYNNHFDDQAWAVWSGASNAVPARQSAVIRIHFKLAPEDLTCVGSQIRFAGIDRKAWVFLNGRSLGNWDEAGPIPPFILPPKSLRAGDNVLAVGLLPAGQPEGIHSDVRLELIQAPVSPPWSRSLFNGLAQVLVQSTKAPGEIQLTATADNLELSTLRLQAQPAEPRPALP